MPRKKKTEVDVSKMLEENMKKPENYGSGMTKINNELMAREEEKNE